MNQDRKYDFSRRRLLCSAVGLTGAALASSLGGRLLGDESNQDEPYEHVSTDKTLAALERLKLGNERFLVGDQQRLHTSRSWRSRLTNGQHPFATILACSDSRVPPELVFDQGFGDLFTIRIAGNVIDDDVLGTLQYASFHLQTPVFVVMGHESCGAVTAAVDSLLHPTAEPSHIEALLAQITPGLEPLDLTLPRRQLIEQSVEANVRASVRQLLQLQEVRWALERGRVDVHGAVYSLSTGRVRFLDDLS